MSDWELARFAHLALVALLVLPAALWLNRRPATALRNAAIWLLIGGMLAAGYLAFG
jgi:uncharacterized membrane protein YdcZ (DUF606 family)